MRNAIAEVVGGIGQGPFTCQLCLAGGTQFDPCPFHSEIDVGRVAGRRHAPVVLPGEVGQRQAASMKLTRAQAEVLRMVVAAGHLPTTAHTGDTGDAAVAGNVAASLVRRGLLAHQWVDTAGNLLDPWQSRALVLAGTYLAMHVVPTDAGREAVAACR